MAGDPGISVSAQGKKGGTLYFVLRALNSRNYRLFFSGQLVSLVGTWLTNVATAWLINRITNDPVISPRTLGWVSFAGLMPGFILGPVAGVMVDRWRKHRVLLWTQALSMLQSFGLAALVFGYAPAHTQPDAHVAAIIIYWLIGLSMFQGVVNAFDIPTRQSFVVALVEKREDLPNAIALNSSMFNSARLVGPAIAGILIARFGEAWCFTIDGVSYLAVLIALFMMRITDSEPPKVHRHPMIEFREGFSYGIGFTPIRDILLLLAAVSFTSAPVSILMPRFATEVLHGDARTQGILTSAIAAGALVGTVRLAARKTVIGLGGQMPWVTVGMGIATILFGLSSSYLLTIPALIGVGYCAMTMMASGNTLLQTIVEDRMRGRIMSLFTMAFMGMMPLGALAFGELASHIGPARAVTAAGGLCILAGLAFYTRVPALRKNVRPIYVQRGILPEVAQGLAAAEAVMEEEEHK